MARHLKMFEERAKALGRKPEDTARVLEQIKAAEGYAFNRSHAVEYGHVTYACAYLSAKYPRIFFKHLINLSDEDERSYYLTEAIRRRLHLAPPDINKSGRLMEISDDTLKNLGKWPLPRDFHASLVSVLKESGCRMIVFDVLFSEPTVYDDALSRAIKDSGDVYLPRAFFIKMNQVKYILEINFKNTNYQNY
jgi:hypothetical protein